MEKGLSNVYMVKKYLFFLLFCLASYTPDLQGQTGPGGVGNALGANGQPTNVIWYQPGTMVNTSGNLSGWTDASGNNNNISQATTTFRPEIRHAAGIGSNYAYFDRNDENDNVIVFIAENAGNWQTETSFGTALEDTFRTANYHAARFGFDDSNVWLNNIETLIEIKILVV